MNDKIGEQLSAYVDGELSDEELSFFLKRLKGDSELQQTWEHYHIISDALRNNLPEALHSGLATRVQNAIDDEPPLQGSRINSRLQSKFFKPVAGLAVAASVAAMAIIGLQNFGTNQTGGDIPQLAVTPPVIGYTQVASGTRWDVKRKSVESRLNSYLVNHNEYTSSTKLQGMLHYARIAAYDVE